jgi:DNA polymerase III subunit delta'
VTGAPRAHHDEPVRAIDAERGSGRDRQRGSEHPAADLFAEVVGQPAALAALRAAAPRPVHAYLLVGPPGSGRRAAARAFAAALLCPEGGCGRCRHCTRALAGSHPDLVLIERTGPAVGVDEARRLVVAAQRRPYETARQVIMVTDLHLAARAAPALLKTIEEPPASTVFVLLADHVPPELATVASRCVEIRLSAVPEAVVARWLTSRGIPPERAAEVARSASGHLGRARLLAEDPGFARRLELWRTLPDRLDGTGSTTARLARQALEECDAALEPLRATHVAEMEHLAEQAEALGERGVPGRREANDRHHREERQWRTDELRAGLGELARSYRDRLADVLRMSERPGTSSRGDAGAASYRRAVEAVDAASAALVRNANELLLLEALFSRLAGD